MQGIRCGMAFRSGALRPVAACRSVAVSRPCVSNAISGVRVGDRLDESSMVAPMNGMKFTMMRHGNKVKHLGRPADQRKALLRGLVTQLIEYGSITTTKVKAKVMRKFVDHMITLAKDGSLHARRQALAYIYKPELVSSLFDSVPERYGDRNGGYTRIKPVFKLRRGDATEMAVIELV